VPLFLLMGQFATLGGMSQALFKAAEAWIGHRKGGVAMAAVGACAGFGAICGSSLATAATMGQVALPELKRAGYAGGWPPPAGRRRHAGHPDPAVGRAGDLRHPDRAEHRQAVRGGLRARHPGGLGYMIVIAIYVRWCRPGRRWAPLAPMPMKERWAALTRGVAGAR
jgi:C4-dicarboxylate transporter, DctM subunit